MLHLISFETMEDKIAIIGGKWLLNWFLDVRDVNNKHAPIWRETCLYVYGVPLGAWGYDNLYNIGCIFGRVLALDYKNFDCAKITVITDCLFMINCKILLTLEEFQSTICISESRLFGSPTVVGTAQNAQPINGHIEVDGESPNQNSPSSPNNCSNDDVPKSPLSLNSLCMNLEKCEPINAAVEITDLLTHQSSPIKNKSPSQLLSNHVEPTSPPLAQVLVDQSSPQQKKPKCPHITNPSLPNPTMTSQPIPLSLSNFHDKNMFGPLQKPSGLSSSNSSSLSGPLFPPGFEEAIPPSTKTFYENRRKRKNQRKISRQYTNRVKFLQPSQDSNQKSSPHHIELSSNDVMKFAEKVALLYPGPKVELQKKIDDILVHQAKDWSAHCT